MSILAQAPPILESTTESSHFTPTPTPTASGSTSFIEQEIIMESELELVREKFVSVKDCGLWEEENIKKRPAMEDVSVIIDKFMGNPAMGFFAIYDGHGGKEVSKIAARELHIKFVSQLRIMVRKHSRPIPELTDEEISTALQKAIHQVDKGLGSDKTLRNVGCTACICFLERVSRRFFSASVGDSRAVLGILKKDGSIDSVRRITVDHKPTDPDELKRVEDLGGYVVRGRVLGTISVSRALGDHAMKKYLVSDAHIQCTHFTQEELDSERHIIVMACDGLWDVVTDAEAIESAVSSLRGAGTSATTAARELVRLALARDTNDNVSVQVIVI